MDKHSTIINFAMFGAGRIGQVHGKNLKDSALANLLFVSDPVAEAEAAMASMTGAHPSTVADIFANAAVDAVVIASSTDTHAELIEQAIDAGKAVFCEKPIDLDLSRARQVSKHVEAANGVCALGFNRRFDPHFHALKAGVDAGQVGVVETVIITSRDPAPPPLDYVKVSGGLYRDMMIHDLDIARWLLGEEPVSVFAVGSCLVDSQIGQAGDVDTAAVTLTTSTGKICQINNSRRATYGYDQRVEVHGSSGMLQMANPKPTMIHQFDGHGERTDVLFDFFMDRYLEAYRIELDAFIQALEDGRSPEPDHHDGVKALALAEACVQSQISGQSVDVDLDAS